MRRARYPRNRRRPLHSGATPRGTPNPRAAARCRRLKSRERARFPIVPRYPSFMNPPKLIDASPDVGSRDTRFFGHPLGLSTLFFTEMWERFSYYGVRALLILFMTAAVNQHGMGLSVAIAGAIYGLYTSCAYIFALPAGWMADRFLGDRKSVV